MSMHGCTCGSKYISWGTAGVAGSTSASRASTAEGGVAVLARVVGVNTEGETELEDPDPRILSMRAQASLS